MIIMKGSNQYSIQIKGLTVAYQSKKVLHSIYLNIERGHIYGLIGPNGAGKSTLFKCILGEIKPNAGEILIEDRDHVSQLTQIAYVPQKDDIDWDFPARVKDIVSIGRFSSKKWYQSFSQDDHKKVEESLKKLDITDLAERHISELSGGQQQRMFIARALCQEPEIFLLDEPFVGVDVKTEKIIMDTLKELAASGKTILVVHHDLDSVQQYFDKVILINQKLIGYGNTAEVFTRENISVTYKSQTHLIQQYFGN